MRVSCNNCNKRDECKTLCKSMQSLLKNTLKETGFYADTTHCNKKQIINADYLDDILYVGGDLSSIEKRDAKKVIISILSKADTHILKLYCKGLSQTAISKKIGITQAAVSKRISSIKNKLEKAIVITLPYIS